MNQNEASRMRVRIISFALMVANILYFSLKTNYTGGAVGGVCFFTFIMFYIVGSGSVHEVLGRFLKSKIDKNQFDNSKVILKQSRLIEALFLVVSLFILCLFIFIFSKLLLGKNLYYLVSIMLIPLLMLNTVTGHFLAFFRSSKLIVFEKLIQIIRQVLVFIVFNLTFNTFKVKGDQISKLLMNEEYSGIILALGLFISMIISEVLVLILCLLIKAVFKNKNIYDQEISMKKVDSSRNIFLSIGLNSLNLIMNYFFLTLPIMFSVFIFIDNSYLLYIYVTVFLDILLLSLFIIYIDAPFMFKKLTRLEKKGELKSLTNVCGSNTYIIYLRTVFASSILIIFAGPIARIFGQLEESDLSRIIEKGSVVLLFIAISTFLGRFLYKTDKKIYFYLPLAILEIISFAVYKIFLKLDVNILTTMILTLLFLYFSLTVVYSIIFIFKLRIYFFNFVKYAVPVVLACIISLLGLLLKNFVYPHLGFGVTFIIFYLLFYLIYYGFLVYFHMIGKNETKFMFDGKLINIFLAYFNTSTYDYEQ